MTDHEILEALLAKIDGLASSVNNLDGRVDGLAGSVNNLDGRINSLDGRVDSLTGSVNKLDGRINSLDGRVDGLAGSVNSLDGRIGSLGDTVAKVAVTQENVVLPRLEALAEGHKTITEKLVPRSRIDEMQEEIDFLKAVVKANTQQINDLKSAM